MMNAKLLDERAMATAATSSDPIFTDRGAFLPVVEVFPLGGSEARLSISRPDGLNSDAHLSRGDVLSIRDYLSMVLGEI